VTWNNLAAVDPGASNWSQGEGGGANGGGSGGGGYGGGGGGHYCSHGGEHSSGGGGGGGSYAISNAASDSTAPTGDERGSATNTIKLTFNLS
jgi:hypothetical protein